MSRGGRQLGVGIIGCGLIGQKRAQSLGAGGRLIACADKDISRAEKLSRDFSARSIPHWEDLLNRPEIDIVVVSTLHDALMPITLAAIDAKKHVLVEKPGARSAAELFPLIAAMEKQQVKVRVGFNHRYHRAFLKAKQLVDEGAIGPLMYIRGRYGHGARLGYEKEWRADAKLSGGGELIDQGPHVIDLARCFLGDFVEVTGVAHTYFWEMPVDDNAFMMLKTAQQQMAFLHVSCTEWKNHFSFEIYGRHGKLEVTGLGGSYGVERLTHYHMLPEMGPPETTVWEYPMKDCSWEVEMSRFYDDILLDREPDAGLPDAYAALKVIQTIYEGSYCDYCT